MVTDNRSGLIPGSAHCTGKPRGSGWDSGRTKLPNPRAPPTPSDADRGGGWERVRRDCRAGGSLEAAAQSKRYLVPLLLTGVHQSPGTQGRTDKNLCRCFGAPARRVFPDHLIIAASPLQVAPRCYASVA